MNPSAYSDSSVDSVADSDETYSTPKDQSDSLLTAKRMPMGLIEYIVLFLLPHQPDRYVMHLSILCPTTPLPGNVGDEVGI